MRTTLRTWLPLVLGSSLLVASCGVPKDQHQATLDTLAERERELKKTKEERDRLKKEAGDLQSNLSSTQKGADARIRELLGDMENAEKELENLRKQREAAEARLASFRRLRSRLRKLVDTGKLAVEYRNGQMILKLPSEILFPSGKAKLSREGASGLGEVLQILLEFKDRRFMVAGHTDNVPIRGRFKNNWYLSTARAVSIVEAMIEAGFDAGNLVAAGFGEFAPIASNETDEGKKLNRRIEIILLPDLSELPNLTAEE